ncbi:MAG TPA: sigma-70 family RNA polymerase sigma factor [Candidatus Coprenecus pullicola]|nr:sigma-70 family RNA polymerase sigma factor [Candidatus Coprenecus pullicola]
MDIEEFKSVFLPLGPLLYRLAFRMLGAEEDARDAVQELYVKLCRDGDRALRSANPQGYCVRMMQNVCADFLRRGRRNVLRRAADVEEVRGGPVVEAADTPIEGREDAALVRRALAAIPPKLREVVILRDLEQMEMSEIETLTGMSQVNIRVTLSRGRKMLKEKIEKFINR